MPTSVGTTSAASRFPWADEVRSSIVRPEASFQAKQSKKKSAPPRYLFSAALYAASAFTLFSGLDSHAASFDCSRAENKAEILICGVPELSALDVKLAKLYRQAREAVSDRVELRNQQRAWLKERNQCDHVACLQNLYQKRI